MAREVTKKTISTTTPSLDKKVAKKVPKTKIIETELEKKEKRTSATKASKTVKKKGVTLSLTHDDTTTHPKIRITDNTKQLHTSAVGLRRQLQVSILSPFRFPLVSEKYVSNFARIAGIFFVTAGALLSLVNLESISNTIALSQDIKQGAVAVDATGTAPTIDTLSSIDQTPDARIFIDAVTPLMSSVPVIVAVPNATEVKLIAKRLATNSLTHLGTATKIDDTSWKYNWSTGQYPDGEYTLIMVIKNQYGNYEYADIKVYTVLNNQLVSPGGTIPGTTQSIQGTSTSGTATTSSGTSNVTPTVELKRTSSEPMTGIASFRVSVKEATEVKVYGRNNDTHTLYYVGSAVHESGDNWVISWNIKFVPNGMYSLEATAFIGGVSHASNKLVAEIKNPTAISTISVSTTSKDVTIDSNKAVALNPSIQIELPSTDSVKSFVSVKVRTSDVLWVELYLLPKNALNPFFLGLARKVSSNDWRYEWQTTQSPNGEYSMYARVKTDYGFTEGVHNSVTVLNDVVSTYSKEQESSIDSLIKINSTLIKTSDVPNEIVSVDEEGLQQNYTPPDTVYIETIDSFVQSVEAEDSLKNKIGLTVSDFNTALNDKLNQLAKAIRTGDAETTERIKQEIEALKKELIEKTASTVNDPNIADAVEDYITKLANDLSDLTIKNELTLKDRIGDAIATDSDKDEISDYDEINLYKTNPFAADTDGDSYIDSAEISHGYNPHDSRAEALVRYESPKEGGIIREDLLFIDSITTLGSTKANVEKQSTESSLKRAILSGKGLPNSFVTLYIYSTPIVVTVKTDDKGSWSYILDKELEDGEHSVYVGITDNAGRVVAKSNPFAFVKTAEAFTKADSVTAAIAADNSAPALFGDSILLLVASIAVVAIGLVLILLGIHVRDRRLLEPIAL